MKKVFVDTNILIDLLGYRKPFSKYAIEIFDKAERRKVELFVSSHSFATTHYLLKKYMMETELREVLYALLDYLTIIAVDTDMIKKGLRSNYKDFEDALQIIAANSIRKLDYIVTRNLKDFSDSGIAILPPDELVRVI